MNLTTNLPESFSKPQPHRRLKDAKRFIPSEDMLEDFKKLTGYMTFSASETNSYKPERGSERLQLAYLRHIRDAEDKTSELIPELCVVNSSSGGVAYYVYPALYHAANDTRLILPAPALIMVADLEGKALSRAIRTAAMRAGSTARQAAQMMPEWKYYKLSALERADLATSALAAKGNDHLFDPLNLLKDKSGESYQDLLNTFLTVHENIMKGKVKGYTAYGRPVTSRKVTNIEQIVKLNLQMFEKANDYWLKAKLQESNLLN